LTDTYVEALAVAGANVIAGAGHGGVFRSSNDGTSWAPINSGLVDEYGVIQGVSSLAISGTVMIAGGNGIYVSSNGGAKWLPDRLGIPQTGITALVSSGPNVYAASVQVYASTNSGIEWHETSSLTEVPNRLQYVTSLAVAGTDLYAGTIVAPDLYRSTNNGVTWTQADSGLTGPPVSAIAASGTMLFAGTRDGAFLSNNGGGTWTHVSEGLPGTPVYVLAAIGNTLFAGTGQGIWRRPLSELVSVPPASSGLPSEFSLKQNYPNPFNPTTTIRYELPRQAKVSLKVYSVLGQEVVALVNAGQPAGHYSVVLNGQKLPSGVYFCRLQAGGYTATKALLLVR
jgi:hypothetical protein